MTKEKENSRLLDSDQAATLLSVSKRHLHRLRDSGAIPAPIRLGRSVRWDRQQLEAWIAKGCPSKNQ